MRQQGLRARRPPRYRRPTEASCRGLVAANVLARQFTVARPNTAWVADITYLWTRGGWVYLAVILDLFSRRVVGWAMRTQLTRALAVDALTMALRRRRPAPGLVHHSDRGSQYTSAQYHTLLTTHGVVSSMSPRANCWDNAT